MTLWSIIVTIATIGLETLGTISEHHLTYFLYQNISIYLVNVEYLKELGLDI